MDCRKVRGHTLYEVGRVLVERLDLMLRELVAWDPATDHSSDSPEVLSGSMLAELLLATHNRGLSGLSYGACEAINVSDDP